VGGVAGTIVQDHPHEAAGSPAVAGPPKGEAARQIILPGGFDFKMGQQSEGREQRRFNFNVFKFLGYDHQSRECIKINAQTLLVA
jgi:hypothetical protein